jgi:hypothetical protein
MDHDTQISALKEELAQAPCRRKGIILNELARHICAKLGVERNEAFKTIPYEYASAMYCGHFFTLQQSFQWLRENNKSAAEAVMGLKDEIQQEMEVDGEEHCEMRFCMIAMSLGVPTLKLRDMIK